jgi:hypothetical protein
MSISGFLHIHPNLGSGGDVAVPQPGMPAVQYFTAEVLAENRTMLALLPSLGHVQTDACGPVVTALKTRRPGPRTPDGP